jgi:arylsulfatase A-like enzyme
MMRHGFELWNTLVHVPLFIFVPGNAPRRIDVPRSGLDIAPTILELFGVERGSSLEGTSLVSELSGAPAQPRDVLVDLPPTSDNARRRALVRGKSKLICFGGDAYCMLYDLTKDPLELHGISKGEEFAAMKARYRELRASIKDVAPYACNVGCLEGAYRNRQ